MTVSVSIPTILRTHTGGEKRVTATGETLQAVISDLESNYSGISERLVDSGKLQRFVNIYVNDEDVRFSGGLDTEINDGDTVTILPAVAGGAMSRLREEQKAAMSRLREEQKAAMSRLREEQKVTAS
jgi:molybdopterin synthase sulfur carrier subunit